MEGLVVVLRRCRGFVSLGLALLRGEGGGGGVLDFCVFWQCIGRRCGASGREGNDCIFVLFALNVDVWILVMGMDGGEVALVWR